MHPSHPFFFQMVNNIPYYLSASAQPKNWPQKRKEKKRKKLWLLMQAPPTDPRTIASNPDESTRKKKKRQKEDWVYLAQMTHEGAQQSCFPCKRFQKHLWRVNVCLRCYLVFEKNAVFTLIYQSKSSAV